MEGQDVRLKALLLERHWQKYSTFCKEYEKAARSIDPTLANTCPSRAQLHRWMTGQLKGLPYPDACRVLEKMFEGWSVEQLMQRCEAGPGLATEASAAPSLISDVARAVAHGLANPGLAPPADWRPPAPAAGRSRLTALPGPGVNGELDGADETTRAISGGLFTIAQLMRLTDHDVEQLADLAGNLVELDLTVEVEIDEDGRAEVRYQHHLFNMTDRPTTRIAREIWFEHTEEPITIEPIRGHERRTGIQRLHETAHMVKFACQISPALQPGEHADLSYACKGGKFVSDHYWRQNISRYTRHFTLRLRHHGISELQSCNATEEYEDGAEHSAANTLIWDSCDEAVDIILTRDHLCPNQAMTLRWEVHRAPA